MSNMNDNVKSHCLLTALRQSHDLIETLLSVFSKAPYVSLLDLSHICDNLYWWTNLIMIFLQ